jgi:hypothetical protein
MWRDNLITGQPLKRCPLRDLLLAPSDATAEFNVARLELYPMFRRGFLYEAGGVADQPARYIAWMNEIDDARAAAQQKYDELTTPPEEGRAAKG